MFFTTSWDDGYALDLKLADLLHQYEMKGTFYVSPVRQKDQAMLSSQALKTIAQHHEIGAHTLRHVWLTKVSEVEARQEIEDSKQWIEQQTEKECSMFCYPYGDHNDDVSQMVRDAGFRGARITADLKFHVDDPFHMPTTLQVSPFPRRKEYKTLKHFIDPYGPLRVKWARLRRLGITGKDMKTWSDLAIALFEYGRKEDQQMFHLW